MRQTRPDLALEYFFTDTGKELPEVYDFLGRLEGFLGAPIQRLNPDRDFDFWLREYNNFCPRRAHVGARGSSNCDHSSTGFVPTSTPASRYSAMSRSARTSTIGRASSPRIRICASCCHCASAASTRRRHRTARSSRRGLPDYYRWRSRSGCTFCFFQQKIEWVNLMREHPDAFEEAKRYEKNALEHGSPFTWSDRESLDELARPSAWRRSSASITPRMDRLRARRRPNALRPAAPVEKSCSKTRGRLPDLSQIIRLCPGAPMTEITRADIYKEQYAHFRSMNDILYKIPPLFTAIMGGLWYFAVQNLDKG